jgi:hypothetical protein
MDPFGDTVFCDDIREEVNGKISLIGCYAGSLRFLGPFPAVQPRLGIASFVQLPTDEEIPALKFLVYFPGDKEDAPFVHENIELSENFRKPLPPSPPPDGMPDLVRRKLLRRQLLLGPIEFKSGGIIRVRLLYGDKRVSLGALEITAVPREDATPTKGH